jgi:hypothetical protein
VRPTAREPQNLACSQAQKEGIQQPRHAYTCAGLIIGAPRISISTSANNGGAIKDCLIPLPYRKTFKRARTPHSHPCASLHAIPHLFVPCIPYPWQPLLSRAHRRHSLQPTSGPQPHLLPALLAPRSPHLFLQRSARMVTPTGVVAFSARQPREESTYGGWSRRGLETTSHTLLERPFAPVWQSG